MRDEQQLRELLEYVAEPPDHIQPPVRQLVERGRRQRGIRTGAWSAAISLVVAIGIIVPSLALIDGRGQFGEGRDLSGQSLFGPSPAPAATGPTAAQLARYHWSKLPDSPLGLSTPDVVAMAGQDLVEIGGQAHGVSSRTGAAFDPVTGTWRRIPAPPFDVGLPNSAVTWTGHQLFVADGPLPNCGSPSPTPPPTGSPACQPHAGLYDPVTNRWTTTELPNSMDGLLDMTATWTGRAVVVAGVRLDQYQGRLVVAAYFPATSRWQIITPILPAGHAAADVAVVATNDRVLLWVMWQRRFNDSQHTGVSVLARGNSGGWRNVSGWPPHRSVDNPSFTGSALLIQVGSYWCGFGCKQSDITEPGFFANPVTLHRTAIPKTAADRFGLSQYLWTGRAIVEVNAFVTAGSPPLSTGKTFAYDPAARRWRDLRTAPTADFLTGTVWTGSEVLALTHHGQLLALHR